MDEGDQPTHPYIKPSGRLKYDRFRGMMAERFPQTFARKGFDKWPLATSIRAELLAACPELEPRHIAIFLQHYCSSAGYLDQIFVGAGRRNLAGDIVARVTHNEAAHAFDKLAKRRIISDAAARGQMMESARG